MKLTSFYKNKLVPSYERISVVSDAVERAIRYHKEQGKPDPLLITYDSRPYYRRDLVMSFVVDAVNKLPKEWKMSAQLKRAGSFHYVSVTFEDLNVKLVPFHQTNHEKVPRKSGYRGDLSAFNFAIAQQHGLLEEFQTELTFNDGGADILLDPREHVEMLENVPFGLILIYDGINANVPMKVAALTPGQDRFLFCDKVRLLKEQAPTANTAEVVPLDFKPKRKVKLNTADVADYKVIPKLTLKTTERKQIQNNE